MQTWLGGYPLPRHPDLGGVNPGTPLPSRPGWGVPPHHPGYSPTIQTWLGYPPPSRPVWGTPPPQTWDGVPPHHPDLAGVPPPPQTWDGIPPHHQDLAGVPPPPPSRPGSGTPPPPASVNRLKILPSPILRMRAVNILVLKTFSMVCRCSEE